MKHQYLLPFPLPNLIILHNLNLTYTHLKKAEFRQDSLDKCKFPSLYVEQRGKNLNLSKSEHKGWIKPSYSTSLQRFSPAAFHYLGM